MAKVVDEKVPYELLIRFDESGALQGAHYQERRIMTVGKEKVKDEPLPPVPLALVSEDGLRSLDDVLGDVARRAFVEADLVNALVAERDGLAERVKALEDQIIADAQENAGRRRNVEPDPQAMAAHEAEVKAAGKARSRASASKQ